MADAADPTIFVPPPQVPVPPVRTIASVPDPEDPYQLETQLIMEDALIYDGWAGLSQVIYSIALSEKGRTSKEFESSWDKLCSDATSGNNYVYHLLRTCSVKLLRSMIRNTLAYDSRHDIDVRDAINERLAWDGPAIYASCTAQGGSVLIDGQTIHPHLGRWLSKTQIDQLLFEVENYIADTPAFEKHNVEIDEFFKSGWKDRSTRRYCPDPEVRGKYEAWIATIKQQCCTGIDPSKEHIPFMRSPMEIGWASHVKPKLQAHLNNDSSTHIHGLVNVLTQKLFGFTKVKQFVLFPVWEPEEMPQIAELLATILCNAYYYNGGLNDIPAGRFKDKTIKPKYRHEWKMSAKVAIGPMKRSEGIDYDRSITRQAQVEKTALLPARKQEYERLRAKLAEEGQRFIEIRDERANRRLKAPEQAQAPSGLPEPLGQQLMAIIANAKIQAEVSDRVKEHLKIPGLPLPQDSRLADALNERLKRIRETVQEKMPNAIVDPDAVTDADLPIVNTDLSEVFKDRGPWDDIQQVSDSSVQDYDSDSDRGDSDARHEIEEGDKDEDVRSDTAEEQGNPHPGSESPSAQIW